MTVRMRPADPRYPEFHLLEEISRPRASLNACRIAVYVYVDEGTMREIVVAGHAESATCASATSILIEHAKLLDDTVEWMLTCGAAYFRLLPQQGVMQSLAAARGQAVLSRMVTALQEVADVMGLIDIEYRSWQRLEAFRARFSGSAGAPSPRLLLPHAGHDAEIIDCAPIIPRNDPNAKPLTFRIEGWDFDCPEFQSVADRHLRKVQRELLRDALRRRRTYRAWLKEWTEAWVERLGWLPRTQADQSVLDVPAPAYAPPPGTHAPAVTAAEFLTKEAPRFLDRGQYWHRQLAYALQNMPYGQASDAELDLPRHPDTIVEIDFARLVRRTRAARADDPSFTWRQRIMRDDPRMISDCLSHIRNMDMVIAPYEKLRSGAQQDGPRELVIATISKQIVMETMIRGWPSVYLDDEDDRKAFAAWAKKYRRRLWSLLAKQMQAQGVALDILLEDNVVYDVRFDDDLRCVIRPLMLVDDTTHAQLHGARTGASVAIPLWPRRAPQPLPSGVLTLAPTNGERAALLVRLAANETSGAMENVEGAAEILRQALACHPAEAGRLILGEWWRRLGRDTSAEFERARSFINAAELLRKQRYAEADVAAALYISREPRPAADAFVIGALASLHRDEDARAEIRKLMNDYDRLARRHDEIVDKLKKEPPRNRLDERREIERLEAMRKEIERLEKSMRSKDAQIASETKRIRELIEDALRDPVKYAGTHGPLMMAVQHAPGELREALGNDCVYESSRAATFRYGDIRRIVEARGLLDILFELWTISHDVEKAPNEAREKAIEDMKRLSTSLWLPGEIESDLRNAAEEFAKGDWDRMQSLYILTVLRDAMSTCQSRMQDLLSSTIVSAVPLKETIATRIHIAQVIETKYKSALDMLLGARISFGGATDAQWTVENPAPIEPGLSVSFGLDGDVVFMEANGVRTPILRANALSAADRRFVEETLGAETFAFQLNRFASSAAEAVLAAEVAPRREWRSWRDAMERVSPELIVALSSFRYAANLMPDHSPPTVDSDEAHEAEETMQSVRPRTYPQIDRAWSELGVWQDLAGGPCVREIVDF